MTDSSGVNRPRVDDEVTLNELIQTVHRWFRYLLSKWTVLLFGALVGGIIGFAYAYFKKPIYTATTTFVLEENGLGMGAIGNIGGLASMAGIDLGTGNGGLFQGDNIISLYKSRKMVQKTLLDDIEVQGKKLKLINLYLSFTGLEAKLAKEQQNTDISFKSSNEFSRFQDSVISVIVKDINQNLLVVERPDKKLSVIKVVVQSPNEVFSKYFNDGIVNNVNDFYVETKTKKSLENVQILEKKTDSVFRVMNKNIYAVSSIADATPNLNPTRQVLRTAPIQKSQFSAEANKAMLNVLVQNLEMSRVALLKEKPLIQVIDTPIFPLEIFKLSKLLLSLAGITIALFVTVTFLLLKRYFQLNTLANKI